MFSEAKPRLRATRAGPFGPGAHASALRELVGLLPPGIAPGSPPSQSDVFAVRPWKLDTLTRSRTWIPTFGGWCRRCWTMRASSLTRAAWARVDPPRVALGPSGFQPGALLLELGIHRSQADGLQAVGDIGSRTRISTAPGSCDPLTPCPQGRRSASLRRLLPEDSHLDFRIQSPASCC